MRIGLIGYGTVGQGVADLLRRHASLYAARAGRGLELSAILVRNTDRERDVPPPGSALLTDEPEAFWNAGFDVLVEAAGGVDRTRALVRRGLERGCDVVTANKALLAAHGGELLSLAAERGRRIRFEAAVAGGLPLIGALRTGLSANRLHAVTGIFNATCNFILSRMFEEDCGYPAAVAAARARGYAEADPALDISGRDAAEKLAIVASIAFGGPVHPDAIPTRGLEEIELEDLRVATAMGHSVKLIAEARRGPDPAHDTGVMLRVCPTLVPPSHPLASVRGGDLAAVLEGDAVGRALMVADAAGRYPTASAVVADVIEIARERLGAPEAGEAVPPWPLDAPALEPVPAESRPERGYVRLHVLHHDGAYDLFRAHLSRHGVEIEQLHETAHTIAAITSSGPLGVLRAAFEEPIAKAFDPKARVVLPVLG